MESLSHLFVPARLLDRKGLEAFLLGLDQSKTYTIQDIMRHLDGKHGPLSHTTLRRYRTFLIEHVLPAPTKKPGELENRYTPKPRTGR